VNGFIADRFGRKWSIVMAVVVFTLGSAIQAGAISVGMIFAGDIAPSLLSISPLTNTSQVVPLQGLQWAC